MGRPWDLTQRDVRPAEPSEDSRAHPPQERSLNPRLKQSMAPGPARLFTRFNSLDPRRALPASLRGSSLTRVQAGMRGGRLSAFTGSTGVQSRWARACAPAPPPPPPQPCLSLVPSTRVSQQRTVQFPLMELPNRPRWEPSTSALRALFRSGCVWPLSSLTRAPPAPPVREC